MATFADERIRDAWREAEPLMRAHHEESGLGEPWEFCPDEDRYRKLDDAGLIRVFTARAGGRLVGYSIFLIDRHLHYGRQVWGMQDVLYMDREHRGVAAVRFMEWTEERLRAMGVQVIGRHVTTRMEYGRTLKRMGYEPREVLWTKQVEVEASASANGGRR